MKSENEWINKAKSHYEQIVEDREFLISKVFKNDKVNKIKNFVDIEVKPKYNGF